MNQENVRDRILTTSSALFEKQGFSNTSLEQILAEAGCSKSSFYHLFENKDELAAIWFADDYYTNWYDSVKDRTDLTAMDKLRDLNDVFFRLMERTFDVSRASALCRHQVSSMKRNYYLDSSRPYNRIICSIILEGQKSGEIRGDISHLELAKTYCLLHRGLVFDWCLSEGSYSLLEFGRRTTDLCLRGFLPLEDEASGHSGSTPSDPVDAYAPA